MDQNKLFLPLTIIFMILPAIWILTDPRDLKERFKDYFKLKPIFYFLIQMLIILVTFVSMESFPWPKTVLDSAIIAFGLILYSIGVFLAVWAKVIMKSSWGMPAEHDIKRQKEIIRKGPFAFSRNPIYLGLILVLLGYTLALRSYSILLVPFIIIYFYKAVLKEEKILTKYFGKEYLEYKSRVRRFI